MRQLNIFIDNHHAELTHSLFLLLGKRLGHDVFYPIGMDWYEKGYWDVYPHIDTAKTYLDFKLADPFVYEKKEILTSSGWEAPDGRFHYCFNLTKEVYDKSVTLETFMKVPIDILVASIPQHVPKFNELIRTYHPEAKLVFQMGNTFKGFHFDGVENVLNSTDRSIPEGLHEVKYSQEFDLGIFNFTSLTFGRRIINFVHYMPDADYFSAVRQLLPEYLFESYGAGNQGGRTLRTTDVATMIRSADFVWNLKQADDGYGHTVHNAAAAGRPLILSKNHYSALRFNKFIEDGVTCINIDGLSPEESARKIRRYGEPPRLQKMGQALYERFRNLVDFSGDAEKVKRFLENLR